MTQRSVLITGGAGFIGSALAHRLSASGDACTVVDSYHPQVHAPGSRGRALPPGVRVIPADVTVATNWDAILSVVGCPSVIVHLAAETGTGQSLTEASRHARVNVAGTTEMLDAFSRRGWAPGQLVLASSRAVYGEGAWRTAGGEVFYPGPRPHEQLVAGRWDAAGPDGEPATALAAQAGTTVPDPSSVYAATKLAQEHVCKAWAAANGTALSILRLQNVYGPGQSLTNSYTGIVALFSRIAADGGVIDVYEDGEIVRDFVFVEDVVSALAAAIASPPETTRLVDIGSGTPTTVLGLAETVARLHGAPAPKVSGRFRDGDVRAASCDIGPARRDLGYDPEWDLERGLTALQEWIDAGTEGEQP